MIKMYVITTDVADRMLAGEKGHGKTITIKTMKLTINWYNIITWAQECSYFSGSIQKNVHNMVQHYILFYRCHGLFN